ncbi:hypothetical protein GCM10010411_37590 [Actinomadura fulvescens]|uniref:Uncharacterized protein n=1 Tax=Actinomadura fulvescens TaxID=46160 RepID=A0ABP6C490_9ACTN
MVVGDQRAGDRLAGAVVMSGGRRHGRGALGDPDGHTREGAAAVAFQVESAFECVVDRLDQLADRFTQ